MFGDHLRKLFKEDGAIQDSLQSCIRDLQISGGLGLFVDFSFPQSNPEGKPDGQKRIKEAVGDVEIRGLKRVRDDGGLTVSQKAEDGEGESSKQEEEKLKPELYFDEKGVSELEKLVEEVEKSNDNENDLSQVDEKERVVAVGVGFSCAAIFSAQHAEHGEGEEGSEKQQVNKQLCRISKVSVAVIETLFLGMFSLSKIPVVLKLDAKGPKNHRLRWQKVLRNKGQRTIRGTALARREKREGEKGKITTPAQGVATQMFTARKGTQVADQRLEEER